MALSNLGLEPSQIFCGKLLREYVNLFFPSNYREREVWMKTLQVYGSKKSTLEKISA